MNLKRLFAGVLACCVVGGVMPTVENVTSKTVITASADDYEEYIYGTYEHMGYYKYGDHIEIVGGDDELGGDLIIPETIEGLPVTKIGGYAFFMNADGRKITSVKLPESIESIGGYAFCGCEALESINIPDKVKSIEYRSFLGCSSLTSITLPESIESIEQEAFDSCTNLESINIPKNLKTVQGWAFSETKWLEEQQKKSPFVSFNGILIDGSACEGEVTIPDDITEIAEGAFSSAENITSIKIPSGVKSIGDSAFIWSSLVSIEIPDTVEHIGKGLFAYCEKLESVVLPNADIDLGLISYENMCHSFFTGCSSIKSVVIPNGVTRIEGTPFDECSGLTSITILNPNCEINDSYGTISETATIYGYENSTAQAYAEKYEINFVSLGAAPEKTAEMGDIDGDGKIDSSDASFVLTEYALLSTGKISILSESQQKLADLNKDDKIDSSDASLILAYYSHVSTGGTDTIDVFLENQGY